MFVGPVIFKIMFNTGCKINIGDPTDKMYDWLIHGLDMSDYILFRYIHQQQHCSDDLLINVTEYLHNLEIQ